MNSNNKYISKIFILSFIIVSLIAIISVIILSRHYKKPIDIESDNVKSVSMEIFSIFASMDVANLEVSIDTSYSIKRMTQIEIFLNKNQGVNRFKKAIIWEVKLTYHMKNGSNSTRIYKGQSGYLELREMLVQIPEIMQELERLTG